MDGSGASGHPATYPSRCWLQATSQENSDGSTPPSTLDTMHTLQMNMSSLTPSKPVCRSRQADFQFMHTHAFSLS